MDNNGTVLPQLELTSLADPSEVFKDITTKVINKTLGYAGYVTRREMMNKLSGHSELRNSLKQSFSPQQQTIYIRSWVDGKSFGGYGHALAKQAVVESKYSQLMGKSKSGLEGMITKRNGVNTTGTLSSSSSYFNASTAKKYSSVASFDKLRVQDGTRINSKGKIVPKYRTIYQLRGDSDIFNSSGLLKFQLKNGNWVSMYKTQIATRPESLFWKNWIQSYGESSFLLTPTQQAITTYMNNRLNEMLEANA